MMAAMPRDARPEMRKRERMVDDGMESDIRTLQQGESYRGRWAKAEHPTSPSVGSGRLRRNIQHPTPNGASVWRLAGVGWRGNFEVRSGTIRDDYSGGRRGREFTKDTK